MPHFTLLPDQEEEIQSFIYHYFFWRTEQEKKKDKENPGYKDILELLFKHFPQHVHRFSKDTYNERGSNIDIEIPKLIQALYIDIPLLESQIRLANRKIVGLENMLKEQQQHQTITLRYNNSVDNNNTNTNNDTTTTTTNKRKNSTSNTRKRKKSNSSNDNNNDAVVVSGTMNNNNNKENATGSTAGHTDDNTTTTDDDDDDDGKTDDSDNTDSDDDNEDNSNSNNKKAKTNTTTVQKKRKKIYPKGNARTKFEQRFRELEHFLAGNGHTRVPYRSGELGRWVSYLRVRKRQMDEGKQCDPLAPEQIERLNSLGFEWDIAILPLSFEERYEDLKKFYELEGHTNVPRKYKNDPTLADWVNSIRKSYRRGAKRLTPERIKMLEDLGFKFNINGPMKTFDERVEECRNYRRAHGHLNFPKLDSSTIDVLPEDERSLIKWVEYQRQQYEHWVNGNKSTLDKARIRKLEDIGFCWNREELQEHDEYSHDGHHI